MPSVAVTVPHSLSDEEAVRRLQQRYEALKAAYAEHLDGLHEQWGDRELHWRLTRFGMEFCGSARVAPTEVCVQMDLPFLAVVFKETIERRIREELSAALA